MAQQMQQPAGNKASPGMVGKEVGQAQPEKKSKLWLWIIIILAIVIIGGLAWWMLR